MHWSLLEILVKINTIVGNGKRFIAYDLVERLKQGSFADVLKSLSGWVNFTDRSRNKKNEEFEPSFDWKECNDEHMVEHKLNYIHENASRGEDRLVDNPEDYEHSSARYYILGEKGRVLLLPIWFAGYSLNRDCSAAESLKERLCL